MPGEDSSSYEGGLLHLCETNDYDLALERVKEWDERYPIDETTSTSSSSSLNSSKIPTNIRRELLRTNSSGLSCLHEVMDNFSRSNPFFKNGELFYRLVRRYRSLGKRASDSVFLAQDRYKFTILHKCCKKYNRENPRLLEVVLEACPAAQFSKDFVGNTPLKMSTLYTARTLEITDILEASMQRCRVRTCLRLCVERLFLGNTRKRRRRTKSSRAKRRLTSFDETDRIDACVSPRPWFVASVLGYCLQRELNNLARHILCFIDNSNCWPEDMSSPR